VSLETGHDLRHLVGEVQGLGLVNESESDCVSDESTKRLPPVGNNLRFGSTEQLQQAWRQKREIHEKRNIKRAGADY